MVTNYTIVFFGNFIEVQRVFRALEDKNICAIIRDESESGRLAGFAPTMQGHQEILVHNDELEKALPIVERLVAEIRS